MKLRSLRTTLAVAFLAVSAVAMLLSGSINMYGSFLSNRKVVSGQQHIIANDAVDEVKGFIQEKIVAMSLVTKIKDMTDENLEEQKFVLGKLLGIDPAFRQVALLNTQNVELTRVSRLSNVQLGQLTDDNKNEILSRMDPEKTYISSIYIDETTFEPMIIIAVPIVSSLGDSNGILMAEVNLKFMWDLVDSIKVGKKGLAYVVDREGELIAFSDVGRVIKGESLVELAKVSEFVNTKEIDVKSSADISKGILGTNIVSTYVPLGMPDWAVVVELPVMEAYEPVINNMLLSLLAMVFSFIVAFIVGTYLSKQIAKPIINLKDATKVISNGDLNTRIKVDSKSEIGELAVNFNQMVVNISTLITNIKQATNMILEQGLLLKERSYQSAQSADAVVLAMEQISHGTEEQANEAELTAQLTNTLGEEINFAVVKAVEVEKITSYTKDLSFKSKDTVQLLTQKAKETDRITKMLSEDTMKLNKNLEKIRDITNAISSITQKTSLLSLNASIEAARAGEVGRGFAVIASEINNLAGQSQNAAKMIEPILEGIQLQTEVSNKTSEQAYKIVGEQMQAVFSTRDAFDEIIQAMDNIVINITEMNDIIKNIDSIKEKSINSVMTISTITQETAASCEEVTAVSEEQKGIADEVKKFADDLHNMGEKLSEIISIFKTKKD